MVAIVILSVVLIALLIAILKLSAEKTREQIPKEAINAISDLGALKVQMASLNQVMQEMKGLVYTDSKAQDRLQQHIEQTLKSIENIRQSHDDFKQRETENRESLKRLEAVIAGTKTKGIAGENILKEALSSFPPKMVQTNVRIKGKEVEFGLVLMNSKIMPIDSKWTSTDLLEELSRTDDTLRRERITDQVQKIVERRVREVSQYIDPEATTPWAIAAIPDSAYLVCKGAHFDAYKQNVILISYSMMIPYLLMVFSLHLQYSSSIDADNLTHYILDVKRHLDKMSEILENHVYKGVKMISNAADDYRQIIGSIKGSISALETQGRLENKADKKVTHIG